MASSKGKGLIADLTKLFTESESKLKKLRNTYVYYGHTSKVEEISELMAKLNDIYCQSICDIDLRPKS